MKQFRFTSLLLLQILVCAGASSLFAATQMTFLKESAIWLEGDSTLHRFASTSTAMTADIEVQLPVLADSVNPFYDGLKNGELKRFTLHVPITTLKSGKPPLDKNLAKTLNAENYPEIVFKMTGYELKPSAASPKETEIQIKGTLTISGKSNDIVLQAKAKTADGYTHMTGSYGLLMTDYGIPPPSFMMGTLKAKNEITVRYDLYFHFTDANKN